MSSDSFQAPAPSGEPDPTATTGTSKVQWFRRLRTSTRRTWRWWLPGIVLVLFLGSATAFIWLSQRYEASQRQDQQIADTLWVEQAIRFQMSRDEEALVNLGNDIVSGKVDKPRFLVRVEHLLRTSREIERIAWYGPGEQEVSGLPAQAAANEIAPLPHHMNDMLRRTMGGHNLTYSETYRFASINGREGDVAKVDLFIPFGSGVLVATYRLDALLQEMVPWWFAQGNEVDLVDAFGDVLATRIASGRGHKVYTHTTLLDLPGTTLYLRTDSIRDKPGVLPNMLAGAVLLLSLTLVWSLWALRRDVTRRTQAEQQLRDQHAFRKAMEDSLVTGLRARDLQGRVTYVNPAFCKMVGYSAAELMGREPPMPYWVPDAIEDHRRRFAAVLAGVAPALGYESVFQRRDGERINVLIYEAPLIDAAGVHTGWMSSVLDVSERRRIEELNRQQHDKLQSGARLATMGEIASTLSHELNQPLAAITSYAAGCLNLIEREKLDARAGGVPAALTEAIRKMLAQAQRAGMIIRSVHELLKKRDPTRAPCELSALIESTLPLIELQARKTDTQISVTLPRSEVIISGDRIMLEQVLLNLTRNAIEAMQDLPAARRRIEISAVVSDEGETVAVEVADLGPGVPEELAVQLFTPFFSTKEEGMGMGLSICRSAVEFHGGHLDYRARPGGGALFRFSLPVVELRRKSAQQVKAA